MSRVGNQGNSGALWPEESHERVSELRGAMPPRVGELGTDKAVAPMLGELLGRLDSMSEESTTTRLTSPAPPDPSAVPDPQEATTILARASRKLSALSQGIEGLDPAQAKRVQSMTDVVKHHVELKDELLARAAMLKS